MTTRYRYADFIDTPTVHGSGDHYWFTTSTGREFDVRHNARSGYSARYGYWVDDGEWVVCVGGEPYWDGPDTMNIEELAAWIEDNEQERIAREEK